MREKNTAMRLFVFLAAGVLSFFIFAGPLAADSAFQQLLPLYAAPSATDGAAAIADDKAEESYSYYIGKLKNGAFGKPEAFAAKAQLAFKTGNQQMVAEGLEFHVDHSAVAHANGWRSQGELYYFSRKNGDQGPPLPLPLVPDQGQKPSRSGDFDQFWIDYTPVPGIPLCTPQVGFRLTVSPYTEKSGARYDLLAYNGVAHPLLKPLATIDAANASWKEREYAYLARRVLGLSPDVDWRYVQSEKNVVLQRRLHERLDDVEAIDIALSPGTSIELVNLMVSRKDNYGAGELVQFSGFPKDSTLPDGQPGVRLNLREALQERFPKAWTEHAKEPGKQHFYLQEIFLYIPGHAGTIAVTKPVRRLALLGNKKDENKALAQYHADVVQTLPSSVVRVNAYRRRIVVDLRGLTRRGQVDLQKIKLFLVPPKDATSCAIHLERAQEVSTYDGRMPVFARHVEDLSRRWGGIFDAASPQDGKVENPGIVGYLPLATLTSADVQGEGDDTADYLVTLGKNRMLQFQPASRRGGPLSYRLENPTGRELAADTTVLVSSVGASLRAEDPMPRQEVNNDLLVLEGRAPALEISWPLAARISEKTWFYFGVTEGANQIGDMLLTLSLADGSVIQRHVMANQPLRLLTNPADVRKVGLRIVPAVIPYRLGLRELAFFEPHAEGYAQAFRVALPTPYTVAPKPVLPPAADSALLIVQPGRIAGLTANLTADEALRFSTSIDPKLDWVRGVRLNYRFPPIYADGGGCFLTLQFNWANGKTERRVCFERPSGAAFIPLASWLGMTGEPRNLGALQSIDWVLHSATGAYRGIPESFDLSFSVEGWAMLSAADRLRISPLFYADGDLVFVDAEHTGEAVMKDYSRKIWVPLADRALPLMLNGYGRIQPVKNDLFTLAQVAVEPRLPMDWGRWLELTGLPAPYAPPRWPKWLFWGSASLLAWATWKKGWWAPGKLWVLGKNGVKALYRVWCWGLGEVGRWSWRQLPRLNLAIGVLALGPGLWEAGRRGLTFSGIMLLVAAGLVAWGANCHRRDQAGLSSADAVSLRGRLVVLGAALGCAAWSLGHYGPGVRVLWGFLPLFGAAYALLPVFYRWGRGFVTHRRLIAKLGGWLAITLGLYGLGLVGKAGTGENYFFTFGGMAAVLALRAGLLVIEPRARDLFPAAAARIYGGAGSLYFSGALVGLAITALLLIPRLEVLAEQVAVVVYYCLVVGTVLEIVALRRVRHDHTDTTPQKQSEISA